MASSPQREALGKNSLDVSDRWALVQRMGVSSQAEASVEYSTAESGSVPVSDLTASSFVAANQASESSRAQAGTSDESVSDNCLSAAKKVGQRPRLT